VEGKGSKSEGAAALRGAAGVEKVGADALAVEYTEYPKVRIKAGGASGAGGGQRSHESTVSAGMDGSCAICVCMCVCVCVCVCVHVCAHTHMHTHTHTHTHMYICMYVCIYMYTYIHTYTYVYICICICIYIYIDIYIYMCVCVCMCVCVYASVYTLQTHGQSTVSTRESTR
jgi:hypothetical protein